MTEAIWLSSEYGPALFEFIERKASRRKKLLISAEILSRCAEPIVASDGPSSRDLDVVRRLILQEADGAIPSAFMAVNHHVRVDNFITAAVMAQADLLTNLISKGNRSPAELVNRFQDPEYEAQRRGLYRYFADVVRDVIGNPFRSRSFPIRWRTSDTVGLARGIYDERAFDRLPILADALMDAGCDNERALSHCRTGGPHVHGCWVIDLMLGQL